MHEDPNFLNTTPKEVFALVETKEAINSSREMLDLSCTRNGYWCIPYTLSSDARTALLHNNIRLIVPVRSGYLDDQLSAGLCVENRIIEQTLHDLTS